MLLNWRLKTYEVGKSEKKRNPISIPDSINKIFKGYENSTPPQLKYGVTLCGYQQYILSIKSRVVPCTVVNAQLLYLLTTRISPLKDLISLKTFVMYVNK